MGAITLKNFRTTADVTMNTRLKDGGVSIDWAGLTNIKAWLFSDAQKAIAGRCDVSINQADSTLLVCEYSASKPQYLGVNRLIVQAKYLGRTKTYDVPVFNFVSRTASATGTVTIDDPTVDVEIVVEDVSSSILDNIIAAALDAAARAEAAAQEAEHMVDIHTGPKGDKGDTGETPDISIGTVTTVEPGTPAAASMGGTPEAPVLNLSIPKGAVGATPNFMVGTVTTGQPGTPVVITITGTAEAPVLNVTIPQGLKGDTGVSADYPITIHNGLDSDATDEALAAFQGKVLDGKVRKLEDKVTDLGDAEKGISNNVFYYPVLPGSYAPDGSYSTSASHYMFPLDGTIKKITFGNNAGQGPIYYGFVSEIGESSVTFVGERQSSTQDVIDIENATPPTAKYFYLRKTNVAVLKINGQSINQDFSDLISPVNNYGDIEIASYTSNGDILLGNLILTYGYMQKGKTLRITTNGIGTAVSAIRLYLDYVTITTITSEVFEYVLQEDATIIRIAIVSSDRIDGTKPLSINAKIVGERTQLSEEIGKDTERILNIENSISAPVVELPFSVTGRYINSDGKRKANPDFNCTNFIKVNEGDVIDYKGYMGSAYPCVAGYSTEDYSSYVGAILAGGSHPDLTKVVIPQGVSFVIISAKATGTNSIPYSAFYKDNTSIYQRVIQSEKHHPLFGKKIAVIGDSISTISGNNTPFWTILPVDVGNSIQSWITYYDVYSEGGTPLQQTIGGVPITEEMIGTLQTFVPVAEDVGKVLGRADNYNSVSADVWSQRLCRLTGAKLLANASWSGARICSGQGGSMVLSEAWSDYTIGRCKVRDDNGDFILPEVIIIYRGTNDLSHSPYSRIDDISLQNGVPDTDYIDSVYQFRAGYYKTIQKLRVAYPGAYIVCCTLNVFKRVIYDVFPTRNSLYTLPQMNDVIREIANTMGCGLIEFDKDGITFENCYPTYISDSQTIPTHPNNNGHRVMAEKAVTDLTYSLNET